MLTLKGIHATTAYHANHIFENGFIVPNENSGKAGAGVYFWHYHTKPQNAFALSKIWYDFALSKGIYDTTQDCRMVQFDCEIQVEESQVLDFIGDIALFELFLETYPLGKLNEQDYGTKLDEFLKTIENISKQKFSVCRMNLSVPNLRKVPFANAFPALIVKKPVDIFIKQCLNS